MDLEKHLFLVTDSQLKTVGKSIFASQILLIFTLSLAKTAIILLVKRCLALDMVRQRRTCDVVAVLVSIWALAAIIGISANCSPPHMVDDLSRCKHQNVRWEVIGIINGVLEIATTLLSTLLVWDMKNLSNEQRIRVIVAFLFRVLLVPVVVVHIYYYMQTTKPGADVPLLITNVLICEQVQIGVSLLTATVPNMKAFIQGFHSQMGMVIGPFPESTQTTARRPSIAQPVAVAPSTTASSPPPSKSSTAPHVPNSTISSKLAEDNIEATSTLPTSSAPI